MAIINTRSPYFISISDASISYATLDLEIFSGEKASTQSPEYSLKKNKLGDDTTITFEVAELIRDFITADDLCKWVRYTVKAFNNTDAELAQSTDTILALQSYSYFEEGNAYDFSNKSLLMSNREIFVPTFGDYSIPFYTDNNATLSFLNKDGVQQRLVSLLSSTTTDGQIASVELFPQLVTNVSFNDASDWEIQPTDVIEDGVLKCNGGTGGRNYLNFAPTTGNQYILEFEIKEYTSGVIAVFDGSGGNNITGALDKVGKYSFTYIQSATSNNKISFGTGLGFDGVLDNISLKEVQQISTINVTDDNDITNIAINESCEAKYTPYKVTFINKFGALQDMYFFKKAVVQMNTKRETYQGTTISNGSYSISDHTKRDFNITGVEKVTLSSGFVSEEYNEVFKQMMLSERVWVTDEDYNVLPINLKTSNINYKTSLNDKLIEYSIEFEKSYNVINNIR